MSAATGNGQTLLFVYGTLKAGLRNHDAHLGHLGPAARLPGEFRSVQRWPLYIIGRWRLPWLLPQTDRGEQVDGQLYRVDAVTLARIDQLELVDEAGWYTRGSLLVQSLLTPTAAALQAVTYFGCPQRFARESVHAGPLASYEAGHDRACLDPGGSLLDQPGSPDSSTTCSCRSALSHSPAGNGRQSRKPCTSSQPLAARKRSCSGSSTPSPVARKRSD